jgi:hypothetical protein
MTGKEILDQCIKVIKRQDIDRTLLLFFVNTARKAVFRDKNISKFLKYIEDVTLTDGKLDITAAVTTTKTYNIKSVRQVEWFYINSDGLTIKSSLAKLPNYESAMKVFGSLETIDAAKAYLILGTTLYVLPIPPEGKINIYGEVWPDNIVDSSTFSDITTNEIGDALVYLGSAEYLDMLGEEERANFWRQKGTAIIDSYMKQIRIQETNDIDLMQRDPFGNVYTKTPTSTTYSSFTLEDLDLGGF